VGSNNFKGGLQLNFKKIFSVLLLLVLLTYTLCACQQSGFQNETESEADADLPELRIGVDLIKPFFYKNENGDYAGIDADIIAEACKRAGYRPKFIIVSWSERDNYLQNGNVDCLWSAFIKDGREDLYHWTDTYLQSNLRVITDSKSPDKDAALSSIHKGMAVRAGSKIEELLLQETAKRPSIQVYSCGTFEMAETAFIKGYVGALGGHEAVLQEIINNYPGLYHFLDGSLMTANLGAAFSKDDTSEHYDRINNAIKAMKADGTITAIYEKYHSGSSEESGVSVSAQN